MNVLLKSSNGITPVSIESHQLSERKIFIIGEINEDTAISFMKQVMYLNMEDTKAPISCYINSPGGEIESGMLIYDVMKGSKAPIHMYVTGTAYSMAAVLFIAASKRLMLPHSRLMLHEPLLGGKIGGNASTIKEISDSLLNTKKMMNQILALHTNKTIDEVDKLTSYDHYFTAKEAKEMNFCDEIVNFDVMMGV